MTRSTPPSIRPGATTAPFVLSLVAFLLALTVTGYIVHRDPPWGRLSKYDFSTPEAAMRSHLKMEANADILTRAEYEARIEKKPSREMLASLEIKAVTHAAMDLKTVVFYRYQVTDPASKKTRERQAVQWFEKDEDTGYWKKTYVDLSRVHAVNKRLAAEISDWTKSSDD